MKNLLTITAITESCTGLLLLVFPMLIVSLLFGVSPGTHVELTVARVAGVAILSLAVACWLARSDCQSSSARGIVSAMILYNSAIVVVLIYTAIGLTLCGAGLWPVVLFHSSMSAWCVISLLKKPLRVVSEVK
jgi:hypothetical protein